VQLTWLDWLYIALYFALNGAIGLYYRSRAGKNVDEFFLSGRNVPWWLAGTSMVATTFAADTPLAVTGMVARGGIAGNWLWWSWVASGFGPLHQVRAVLFWSMWLFIGIQVIFASFFLSMLGISRGTYIGDYDLK